MNGPDYRPMEHHFTRLTLLLTLLQTEANAYEIRANNI